MKQLLAGPAVDTTAETSALAERIAAGFRASIL